MMVTSAGAVYGILTGFALLAAPLSFLNLTAVAGQIKCLVLVALLVGFRRYRMPSTLFGDLAQAD